jgi:hypothetical protein
MPEGAGHAPASPSVTSPLDDPPASAALLASRAPPLLPPLPLDDAPLDDAPFEPPELEPDDCDPELPAPEEAPLEAPPDEAPFDPPEPFEVPELPFPVEASSPGRVS